MKTSKETAKALCRSFTSSDLIQILGVSKRTASRYRAGHVIPPKGFITLLESIEAGRLMPECWPNEIRFSSDKLYTGVGKVNVNWSQLQHYEWTILQWHNSLRLMDTQRRELDRLKVILSPADQLAITMRSRSVTRMAAKIKPDMHQLKKKILHRLIGC